MIKKIKHIYQLGKFPIAVAISFTCLIGYLLHGENIDTKIISLSVSLIFFTASSLAFNQIQERDIDKKMSRTKNRPLVSDTLKAKESYVYASILLIASSLSIYLCSNIYCLILAFVAIILYNMVYTPLKKHTPTALLFGSISGSLPPIIGWYASGDFVLNETIICFCLFIFLGQIPHFIFLLIKYSDDYKKAGFKTIVSNFSSSQIKTINTIWLISFVSIGLMFPFFDIINSKISITILVLSSILLLLFNYKKKYTKANSFLLFIYFNIYFTLSNILIIGESINK